MEGWEGYDAASYGDRIADAYDALPTHPQDADAAVTCLVRLADDGPALELGIGTERLALPLARRGVAVSGIDASKAMVARLRSKPGGDHVPVAIRDFADVDVDGHDRFSLIFIVYNTFFALCDADAQRRCFEHVAAHLMPGGRFLIEAFVPDPGRFVRDQHIEVRHIGVPIRYSYPSELDLMAEMAGLRLEHRWGGWEREPFTGDSVKHVSVYADAS